jgi:hypothetical protein
MNSRILQDYRLLDDGLVRLKEQHRGWTAAATAWGEHLRSLQNYIPRLLARDEDLQGQVRFAGQVLQYFQTQAQAAEREAGESEHWSRCAASQGVGPYFP